MNQPFFSETFKEAGLIPRDQQAEREVQLVLKLAPKVRPRILDLGCGIGRHSLRLARAGSAVTALDNNKDYLDCVRSASQSERLDIDCCLTDFRSLAFNNEFDCVISFYTSFGYYSDVENLDILTRVNQATRVSGFLLMEVFNRDYAGFLNGELKTDIVANGFVRKHHQIVSGSNMLSLTWHCDLNGQSVQSNLNVRLYRFVELESLLSQCGFSVSAVWGDTDQRPFIPDGKKMVILAKK